MERELHDHPTALVTDVSSVKAGPLEALRAAGADLSRYIGSHPMAGSQFTGPLTASGDLFKDRTWVVTPVSGNTAEDVATVEQLARDVGARVVTMPPQEHDEAVAQVSHLPHLMSILTASHLREVPTANLRLAGQGIRHVEYFLDQPLDAPLQRLFGKTPGDAGPERT